MNHDKILILDFGSQVTQLIARRVREAQVYCEIQPNDVSDAFIRDFAQNGGRGIILSGSHASTYEDHALRAPQAVWDCGLPVLGICYGMQTMAVQLGSRLSGASTANSVTPSCAPTATPACSTASRISRRSTATACSRFG